MHYPKLTDQPGALALAARIRAGELSPREAVDAAIARIEKLDTHVNALAVGDFDRACETARAMSGAAPGDDQPLFGVPMTIKESFDVAGLPTSWGLPEHTDYMAMADSTVAAKLKAAGAIILGKSNVPPDLVDWQSNNPVYGRTNNPHDHDRTPGGSSGGSAAMVASGMVPCDYGTDIGGSVRVPAHFCGVWGHKTSYGLVSKRGHESPVYAGRGVHDSALSVAGPLARNADDLAALLRVTADFPMREHTKPLAQCRVLALFDHPVSPIDQGVRDVMERTADALEGAGVAIDRQSDLLPDLAEQHRHYLKMMNTSMSRGGPAKDGSMASARDWFAILDEQDRNQRAWAALFETYNFVLAPPAPVVAFPHNEGSIFRSEVTIDGEPRRAAEGLAWSGLATLPHLPSTVLPVGDCDKLPCGMQVIGPLWGDLDCIATARAIGLVLQDK